MPARGVAVPPRGPSDAFSPMLGAPLTLMMAPPGAVSVRPTSTPAPTPAPVADAAAETPVAPSGWGRKLMKVAGYTAMAVSAATTLVGGIAAHGNYEALQKAPSLSLTLDTPEAAPAPARIASSPAPAGKATPLSKVQVPADGVSVLIPGKTLTKFAGEMRAQPEVRRLLDRSLAEVRANLEKSVGSLPGSQGQVLVDLQMPLPTGDRAFLHVGEVDLPSMGLRQLHTEKVPLAVRYDVQPDAARLTFDLEPVDGVAPVKPDGLDGGVYVGAIRVRVALPSEGVPVKGQVSLGLDMDSQATNAEQAAVRARLEKAPAGSPQAKRLAEDLRKLEWRAEGAQRLKVLGSASNLDYGSYLEKAFEDQRVALDARIHTGGQPLVDTVVHLWLGQDVTKDGMADLHLATDTDYSMLDRIQVEAQRVESIGARPDGNLEAHLHDQVGGFFQVAAKDLVPRLANVVRETAARELSSTLKKNLPMAQGFANGDLARTYGRAARLDMDMPTGMKDARLDLTRVEAVGQGDEASVLVHYRTDEGSRKMVPLRLPDGMKLGQGDVAVRLGGAELAQQVGDVSQGGTMHWNKQLDGARQQAGLRKLEFGKDAQGRTVFPKLVMEKGRLALNFDLVMEPDAPGFVRPTIHRGVMVPLQVAAQDGKLILRPDAEAVRFTGTKTETPFEAMDLLPTRWIGNLVGNIVADSEGPAQLSAALREVGYPVDLRGHGLAVREVGFVSRGNGMPDVVARMGLTKDAPSAVVRQFSR